MGASAIDRPAWLEIDLSAISSNIGAVHRLVGPQTDVMAVIKANAYGHGLEQVAKAAICGGAAALGVAILQEGLKLREAGIDAPVVVLGPTLPDQAEALVAAKLSAVVSTEESICALSKAANVQKTPANVHLKIDTGMGRVGIAPHQARDFANRISCDPHLKLEGVATHIAWECVEDYGKARAQIAQYTQVLDALHNIKPRWRHIANSAMTLHVPESRFDMVRVGLLTYGLPPAEGAANLPLRPAMSLKARIIQVRNVSVGQTLSYGGSFTVQRPSRIALLPLGYADGYNRRLSNRAQVLINGQRCPVVGKVCMDLTLVDITDMPPLKPGAEVVLLGQSGNQKISVNDLANWMEGIPHEVIAQLGTRLPRRYLNDPTI
jgi:alanine racemase